MNLTETIYLFEKQTVIRHLKNKFKKKEGRKGGRKKKKEPLYSKLLKTAKEIHGALPHL